MITLIIIGTKAEAIESVNENIVPIKPDTNRPERAVLQSINPLKFEVHEAACPLQVELVQNYLDHFLTRQPLDHLYIQSHFPVHYRLQKYTHSDINQYYYIYFWFNFNLSVARRNNAANTL